MVLHVNWNLHTHTRTHTHTHTHTQSYLFVMVMISEGHDLMNLIIQSIRHDLESRNPTFNTLAMQCIANIASKEKMYHHSWLQRKPDCSPSHSLSFPPPPTCSCLRVTSHFVCFYVKIPTLPFHTLEYHV